MGGGKKRAKTRKNEMDDYESYYSEDKNDYYDESYYEVPASNQQQNYTNYDYRTQDYSQSYA